MSKSVKIIIGMIIIAILAGIGSLFYVEYVILPKKRAERIEREGERKWEDMSPPAEWKDWCEKNDFQWTLKYQDAYMNGRILEVWMPDSVGTDSTLVMILPVTMHGNKSIISDEEWAAYKNKMKVLKEKGLSKKAEEALNGKR